MLNPEITKVYSEQYVAFFKTLAESFERNNRKILFSGVFEYRGITWPRAIFCEREYMLAYVTVWRAMESLFSTEDLSNVFTCSAVAAPTSLYVEERDEGIPLWV